MSSVEVRVDASVIDLNEYFGANLFRIVRSDCEIYEYDFQFIPDETLFCKTEQTHYLLVNKRFLKAFYVYWRARFFALASQGGDVDLVSLMVLLVNANFASAWSRRKSQVVQASSHGSKFDLILKTELAINRLILVKNFKCEQAFVVKRFYQLKHSIFQDMATQLR